MPSSATALIQQKMPAARSITGFLVRSGRCRRLLADGNDKEDLMQVGLLKLVQLARRDGASPERVAAHLFIAIKRQSEPHGSACQPPAPPAELGCNPSRTG